LYSRNNDHKNSGPTIPPRRSKTWYPIVTYMLAFGTCIVGMVRESTIGMMKVAASAYQ
jgi:hypothetical protein